MPRIILTYSYNSLSFNGVQTVRAYGGRSEPRMIQISLRKYQEFFFFLWCSWVLHYEFFSTDGYRMILLSFFISDESKSQILGFFFSTQWIFIWPTVRKHPEFKKYGEVQQHVLVADSDKILKINYAWKLLSSTYIISMFFLLHNWSNGKSLGVWAYNSLRDSSMFLTWMHQGWEARMFLGRILSTVKRVLAFESKLNF
jgi:hypothetical protein